ncbi:type III secretion system regulator LcrR, partial [Vibrio parahaemolyticus 861]
LTAPMRRHALR